MHRRQFLSALIAGAAGLPGPAPAQPRPAPTPQACRIRPNVNALTSAQLAALRQGVHTMMSRPVTDPTSWAYQAAMHGTAMTPVRPLWNGCQHGSLHFLSWHRLFLYRFERILRQASGSPSFNLPYWDWTSNRQLPAPFRDSSAGNPLFTPNRNAAVNAGALLPASAVTYAGAFSLVPFANFSSSLEGTPHGVVHTSVGGWMAFINSSAQDPIFWLHHANIDRLWRLWLAQGGGRSNPAAATWRDQNFSFFDENGNQVTMSVSQTLDSCRNLGYTYQQPGRISTRNLIAAAPAAVQLAAATRPRAAVAPTGGSAEVVLGSRPAEVTVPLPQRRSLVQSAGGEVHLSFEDITVSNPEGYYEVYLNPPPDKPPEPTDRSYVGNLSLFGIGEGGDHGHTMPPSRALDITAKVKQLGLMQAASNGQLRVVLVLREPELPGAQRRLEAVAAPPRARIGQIRVVTSP